MRPHALPPLSYDYGALQPWIDEQTVRIHHGYHHLRCVEALNGAQERLTAAWQSGDFHLIRYFQRLVALHGSEHSLHKLFWEIMGPNQGGQPRGELADQITEDFGLFATFKSQFSAAATSLEAGGWAVLTWQPWNQQLAIVDEESQRLHAERETGVLLALDVSEHAYYLRYQHRRAEYVHNWWNTVNWPRVAERFSLATSTNAATPEKPGGGTPKRSPELRVD